MFSENQKISIRQIRRLLILDLFGVSSLLLPGLMAKTAGIDGIFCMVAAGLLAVIYIKLMELLLKRMKGEYYIYSKRLLGNFGSDLLMLFYLFFFLLLAAFVLFQLTGMVRTWLLPQGSYNTISLLILLLAGYGTLRGIEGRARIYEIIFWFLGIPLLLMLFLAARDVNVAYWSPIANISPGKFASGVFLAGTFYLPVSFLLFLKPHCNQPERLGGCAKRAVWLVTILNISVYLILVGNFQVKTTGILKYPIITLMSMVKLPGEFLKRMEALMTAVWFFSVFALMHTAIYYAADILKKLFGEKKTSYGLVVILVLVFTTTEWFYVYPQAVQLYTGYIKYVATPVLVLLPVILLLGELIRSGTRSDK